MYFVLVNKICLNLSKFMTRILFTLLHLHVRFQVLVVIDAKPKDLGLPTEAYIAIEEVHDVRL